MAEEPPKKPPEGARRRVRAKHPTMIGLPVSEAKAVGVPPPGAPPAAKAPFPSGSLGAKLPPRPSAPKPSTPKPGAPGGTDPFVAKPPARPSAPKPATSGGTNPLVAKPPSRPTMPMPTTPRRPRPSDDAAARAREAPPIQDGAAVKATAIVPSDPPPAPEVEELEGPPTQVGSNFAAPAPEPSGFAGPELAPAVHASEEPAVEEPSVEVPVEAADEPPPDLPFEPTMPAAAAPEPPAPEPVAEPEPPAPASERISTEPRDLPVEPTVVVHPSLTAPQQPQPTYRVDVSSGAVQLEEEPPQLPKRSAGPFIALGVLVGLLVLGGGGALVWFLVLAPREVEPAVVASEPTVTVTDPAPSEPAPSEPAPSEPAPPAEPVAVQPAEPAEPPTEPIAAEPVAEEGEGEELAEEEAAPAPAPGQVIPRDQLEGFELDLPRLSPRARRMSEAERRTQSIRLRSAALRAYRDENYAEAEGLFRQALEHVPWDVAAVEGLARATAQQSRFAEAIAWGNLAVERNPRSAAAYRVLGDVWRQAGHPDEAARAYRRGLFRDPQDRWLRQRLREVQ